MSTRPSKDLEVVPNSHPGRDYEINIDCPEFTCLCPRTGQPDFATIGIHYTPGETIVELKSLKLYLWAFRDRGIFHEAVANEILDDLVAALDPQWMRVTADFNVRGGISMQVAAEHPDGTCGSGLSTDAIDRLEGLEE